MNLKQAKELGNKICISMAITGFFLFTLETGSFLVLRLYTQLRPIPYLKLSQYETFPWVQTYRREAKSLKLEYKPYVVWRRAGYIGDSIRINSEGLRRTYNSHCDSGTYKIYIFGGSALWGTGSPDWETIPSLIAGHYVRDNREVCIRNYGETAWVNTQEVIKLMLELKSPDRKPDLVIFYDGANDVYRSYQSGGNDVHQNFGTIKRKFEEESAAREGGFRYIFKTNTVNLLSSLANRLALQKRKHLERGSPMRENLEASKEVVQNYLRNMDIVGALAVRYGFKHLYFWQPTIFTENKPLTLEEKGILEFANESIPGLKVLCQNTYKFVQSKNRNNLFYIADVFNDERDSVFLDWVHVGPKGNRIIAQRIYKILKMLSL